MVQRHEDEEYVEVYEKVEDFINNLILHCPDENFKMVRYYRFYSSKNKLDHLKFRSHMIKSFQKDPLLCSCGHLMECEHTYNPFEGGTLNDRLYREKCINDCRRLSLDRRRT